MGQCLSHVGKLTWTVGRLAEDWLVQDGFCHLSGR